MDDTDLVHWFFPQDCIKIIQEKNVDRAFSWNSDTFIEKNGSVSTEWSG